MGKKHSDYQKQLISQPNDRHHFRAFKSALYHENFLRLTASAKMLYIYMGLASRGKTEFEFPKSKYDKILSKDGFLKAKRQLINEGFLEEERYRTKATIYRLSNKWYSERNSSE